jgi:hypothetical protein
VVNVVLIDTNPFTVTTGLGEGPNTGTRVVTLPPTSQLKCSHRYLFYIEDAARTRWTYGAPFIVTCGDQTMSGVVTAAAFVGDGSGLTGITVTTANTANFAATANSANFATTAGSAASATNSMALGGISPASYARLDIGNAFTGSQDIVGNIRQTGNMTVSGNVTIGGGTPITKHLSATFDPVFPNLKPGACSIAAFPFSGVADGDTLALGVPSSRLSGGGVLQYFGWVSANDVVTIRVCNIDPNSPQKAGGTGTIRIDVWKH